MNQVATAETITPSPPKRLQCWFWASAQFGTRFSVSTSKDPALLWWERGAYVRPTFIFVCILNHNYYQQSVGAAAALQSLVTIHGLMRNTKPPPPLVLCHCTRPLAPWISSLTVQKQNITFHVKIKCQQRFPPDTLSLTKDSRDWWKYLSVQRLKGMALWACTLISCKHQGKARFLGGPDLWYHTGKYEI